MKAIAYQTKLESNTIHLMNVDNLIGKEVIITVVEVEQKKPEKKPVWKYAGSVNLHGALDKVNIRDLAHE